MRKTLPPAGRRATAAACAVIVSLAVAGVPASARGMAELGAPGPAVRATVEQVVPAVVNIETVINFGDGAAAGTGIILTAEGVVVTNHHVIEGATRITATDVGNDREYTATVLGYDSRHDVAVLKLKDAADLEVAPVGNSSDLRVGEGVVAVGNAGGTGGSPTLLTGKVTGLHRTITIDDGSGSGSSELTDLIKISAKVKAGQSGGPLVESDGDVVGINTAAAIGPSGASTGGWAIPINRALAIAKKIRAGKASRTIHIGPTAFLGVLLSERQSSSGVLVTGVIAKSAAASLGIERGDRITRFNGTKVATATGLAGQVGGQPVGSVVRVDWVDADGQTHGETATLGAGPVGQ